MLNDPSNNDVLQALRSLWETTQDLYDDIQSKRTPLEVWIVPSTMSIQQISTAIYGDNTHAVELLQLNDAGDAMAVLAGTRIRYYPKAA